MVRMASQHDPRSLLAFSKPRHGRGRHSRACPECQRQRDCHLQHRFGNQHTDFQVHSRVRRPRGRFGLHFDDGAHRHDQGSGKRGGCRPCSSGRGECRFTGRQQEHRGRRQARPAHEYHVFESRWDVSLQYSHQYLGSVHSSRECKRDTATGPEHQRHRPHLEWLGSNAELPAPSAVARVQRSGYSSTSLTNTITDAVAASTTLTPSACPMVRSGK